MPKTPKKPGEADKDAPGKDMRYDATPGTKPKTPVKPAKPPEVKPAQPPEVKKTWVEFQLLDAGEEGKEKPVPNEPCQILVGDKPLAGAPTRTDGKGIVRIADKTASELKDIKIRFPKRYDGEWKHLRFEDPKAQEATTGD